jgi:hypothetical protein
VLIDERNVKGTMTETCQVDSGNDSAKSATDDRHSFWFRFFHSAFLGRVSADNSLPSLFQPGCVLLDFNKA